MRERLCRAGPQSDWFVATMAGMVAIDFVTASAPTVAAADIAIKAAFIDINDVLRPVFGNDAAPLPQIGDPLLRITLFVF